jgi:hypothetical protein
MFHLKVNLNSKFFSKNGLPPTFLSALASIDDLITDYINISLATLFWDKLDGRIGDIYLRVGRKLARIFRDKSAIPR